MPTRIVHAGWVAFINLRMFPHLGKILILMGAFMALIGGILLLVGKVPYLGKLPGDITIQKKNFTFYFPLATSIVISLLVSLILLFLNIFTKK